MPRSMYDVLQNQIKRAIDMLEGKSALPNILDVSHLYRGAIVRILKQWQEEAIQEYPTDLARHNAVTGRQDDRMNQEINRVRYMPFLAENKLPGPTPKGCGNEVKFYEATGILPLSASAHRLYDQELQSCIEQYASTPPGQAQQDLIAKAASIADTTWATNVTMVDLD
jgi:hypothetical protein